ncbi:hypothetical protein C8F04DRAFT_1299980 [Mycena alexandri]|uniref:Uncharacterized protein n=1 Tax=Mycena alexandri TaxID=1745969 RepID=A0AAD6SCQ5_9AGAR|nr:hypothetical protein C8F04DRAFT_1299980 [Mycena alexandri]
MPHTELHIQRSGNCASSNVLRRTYVARGARRSIARPSTSSPSHRVPVPVPLTPPSLSPSASSPPRPRPLVPLRTLSSLTRHARARQVDLGARGRVPLRLRCDSFHAPQTMASYPSYPPSPSFLLPIPRLPAPPCLSSSPALSIAPTRRAWVCARAFGYGYRVRTPSASSSPCRIRIESHRMRCGWPLRRAAAYMYEASLESALPNPFPPTHRTHARPRPHLPSLRTTPYLSLSPLPILSLIPPSSRTLPHTHPRCRAVCAESIAPHSPHAGLRVRIRMRIPCVHAALSPLAPNNECSAGDAGAGTAARALVPARSPPRPRAGSARYPPRAFAAQYGLLAETAIAAACADSFVRGRLHADSA